MSELLLVSNPHRRRRRKMSAAQRKYFGGKKRRRRSTSRRRRHHVARRRTHHRRRRHVAAAAAPRRRRRRHLTVSHRRHRRHRNPLSMGGFTGAIMPTVKAGATGAVGALGLDVLWGFASGNATLSPYLSNAYVGFAAKGLGAVAVGALGGKILRGKGRELAVGAMTVVVHDFLKSLLESTMPGVFGAGGSIPLGSYLSGSAPIVGTTSVPQAYLPFSGLGSYLSGDSSGSVNAAGSFTDDTMGMDPWGGNTEDGRIGYS